MNSVLPSTPQQPPPSPPQHNLWTRERVSELAYRHLVLSACHSALRFCGRSAPARALWSGFALLSPRGANALAQQLGLPAIPQAHACSAAQLHVYCSFAIIPSLWDGGRCRKCQRLLLRKKMSERADWDRDAARAPNFAFRAAHLRLRQRPPSRQTGVPGRALQWIRC